MRRTRGLRYALLVCVLSAAHGGRQLRATGEPTSTSAPSEAMPSPPITNSPTQTVIPRNDLCVDAIGPIPATTRFLNGSADFLVEGTTIGSTKQEFQDRCAGVSFTGSGVWYYTFGTGHILTATTCWPGTELDTKISVFSGNCTSLICEQGNDDASSTILGSCEANRLASRASWSTQLNELYYIYVHSFMSRVGDFVLSIEANNDQCDHAVALEAGDSIRGDTRGADIPFAGNIQRCGNQNSELVGEGPSLWYTIVGTGTTLQATTCTGIEEDDLTRSFKVHVFETCGDEEACIGGHSPAKGCSTYEWDAQEGTIYYILVHGYTFAFAGVFDLTVKELS